MKFGLLTILDSKYFEDKKSTYVYCQCDCGNSKWIRFQDLRSGHTRSCGCTAKSVKGLSNSRIYRIWCGMKYRCSNPNCDAYKYYGGRGIKVDDAWAENFLNFYNDMYESYQEHVEKYGENDTSIDRIDYDENYCRDNCRWATSKEQNNHLRPKIDREDIVGKKFGRLDVISLIKLNKRGLYYHCKCSCGNEVNVLRSSLLSGMTRSCGCLQKDKCSTNDADVISKKFNKLTVISFAFVKKHRKYYNCKCDCGKMTTARISDLRNGHKKSCGRCKIGD